MLENKIEETEYMATHDALTDLPNRRFLEKKRSADRGNPVKSRLNGLSALASGSSNRHTGIRGDSGHTWPRENVDEGIRHEQGITVGTVVLRGHGDVTGLGGGVVWHVCIR